MDLVLADDGGGRRRTHSPDELEQEVGKGSLVVAVHHLAAVGTQNSEGVTSTPCNKLIMLILL